MPTDVGQKCWLCGDPIPLVQAPGEYDCHTRDHVKPRSMGGGNGRKNLRPAHRRCNSRRGNDDGARWWYRHPTARGAVRSGYLLPPPTWIGAVGKVA